MRIMSLWITFALGLVIFSNYAVAQVGIMPDDGNSGGGAADADTDDDNDDFLPPFHDDDDFGSDDSPSEPTPRGAGPVRDEGSVVSRKLPLEQNYMLYRIAENNKFSSGIYNKIIRDPKYKKDLMDSVYVYEYADNLVVQNRDRIVDATSWIVEKSMMYTYDFAAMKFVAMKPAGPFISFAMVKLRPAAKSLAQTAGRSAGLKAPIVIRNEIRREKNQSRERVWQKYYQHYAFPQFRPAKRGLKTRCCR